MRPRVLQTTVLLHRKRASDHTGMPFCARVGWHANEIGDQVRAFTESTHDDAA